MSTVVNQSSSKSIKAEKPEKPELESILKYAKRNVQQLCNILPESVVVTRNILTLSAHQEKKRNALAAAEKGLTLRNNDVQVKTARFRVEMKELRIKETALDKELYSVEEQRKQIVTAVLDTVKKTLFEKENTGDSQAFNSMVSKKWGDVEAANGIERNEPQIASPKMPKASK